MADLSEIQSSESVKIIGSASNGLEQSPVQSTGNGALHTNLRDSSGNELGTPANPVQVQTTNTIITSVIELPTFSVISQSVQIGNLKSLLSIVNTGTSLVKIREIWLINDRTTAVTGVAGDFEFKRITGHSAGSALTPVSYDTIDSLPSGITVLTGSTVSGESNPPLRTGTWSTDEWGPGVLDQEGMDHGLQQIEPFWKQTPNGKAIVLRQNQGAHLKFVTNSTAGYFNVRLIFTTE